MERDGVGGVLLAGTELPILLRTDEHCGIPLLDTTVIHARAAAREAWGPIAGALRNTI